MALTAKLWSLSGLSVELGVNVRTIGQALSNVPADGTIEGGHSGWYLLTALAALGCRIPVRGHRLSKLNGTSKHGTRDAYTTSRTLLARERARLLQLRRQETEGKLAPIEILADTLRNMALFLRAAALALPTKCAPRLVMLRTPGEAKAVLEAEIRDWLTDISNTRIRASKEEAGTRLAGLDRGRGSG
jgi:hypothetical protein